MGGENLGGCPPDVHSCGKVHLGFYRHSNSLGSGVVVNVNGVAQTTIARPTIAGFNGKIYIAWVGTDTAHHLNVASSTDGLNFGSKQTLTDTSFTSPYLTVFNNQLHLTFTGTTNNLVTGFFLDGNPTLQSHTTVGQTSPSEPGTASFGGKLYLGWQGVDGAKSTNLAFAADGLHFSSPTHPSRAGSSSTEFGPGLGTFNGHLYYVWAAALLFPNIFTSLNLVQVA